MFHKPQLVCTRVCVHVFMQLCVKALVKETEDETEGGITRAIEEQHTGETEKMHLQKRDKAIKL